MVRLTLVTSLCACGMPAERRWNPLPLPSGRVLTKTRHRGHPRFTVVEDGGVSSSVGLPDGADVVAVAVGNDEPDRFVFACSSFLSPTELREWGFGAPVIDRGAASTRGFLVRADDGVDIPCWLVSADPEPTPRPTLLTAYGGFGVTVTPAFSPMARAWMESGGRYVVAGIRGGGDRGAGWHAAGSGRARQRSIDDLVCVARWLVESGMTRPDLLVLRGLSHGALTVATALLQRPELFAGAACSAGVYDLIRFDRDPAGAAWRGEYGDPRVEADIDQLLEMSPYHQVDAVADEHPALLLTSSAGDRRVVPWHSRKFAARVAAQWRGGAPVLLYEAPAGGHDDTTDGAVAREVVDVLTFSGMATCLAPGC